MAKKILAAAKIPQEWSEILDRRAIDKGISRSKVIQLAIAQYLNKPIEQEMTLVELAKEVDELKKPLWILSISSQR